MSIGKRVFLSGAAGYGATAVMDHVTTAYVLGLTAPATKFPREAHLRGLAGHIAYGAALGGLLAVARRLSKD